MRTDRQHNNKDEMKIEQANGSYDRVAATQVGDSNCEFAVHKKGLPISNSPVDGTKNSRAVTPTHRYLTFLP